MSNRFSLISVTKLPKVRLLIRIHAPEYNDQLEQKRGQLGQAEAQIKQAEAALVAAEAAANSSKAMVAQAEAGVGRSDADYMRWDSELKAHSATGEQRIGDAQVS